MSESEVITTISKNGLPKFQFLMKKAPGEELHTLVSKQKLPNDPIKILRISRNFLNKVRELHEKKIIHRDLYSRNILVDTKTEEVTIIDVGLALEMNKDHTANDGYLHHTDILAPEAWELGYSEATDIFAAGLVLEEISVHYSLPKEFHSIVCLLCAKNPKERPSLAKAVADLESVITDLEKASQNLKLKSQIKSLSLFQINQSFDSSLSSIDLSSPFMQSNNYAKR